MTTPRETEKLNGELEIDYQRNRVKFHPNALCESAFSLPLTPLDVDIVRSLTQIGSKTGNAQPVLIAAIIRAGRAAA